MNSRLLFKVRAIAAAGAVATLALMAWAASWSWSGLAFMVALMAWCVSPYVLLALVARKPHESRGAAISLLAAVSVIALFAVAVYFDTFFLHPDAQGALVFLFIPFLQWTGATVGILVAAWLESKIAKPA